MTNTLSENIKTSLTQIFSYIRINPSVVITEGEEDSAIVEIEGEDLNFLIGYRGESLDALQTILGLILYKQTGKWVKLTVDINKYKDQKKEKLEQIAKNFIDKVRFLQKEIELPPMNPSERRLIHMFLESYDDVEAESRGEGQDRRLFIKPKKV
jgi:spoIIIJ-associated protein